MTLHLSSVTMRLSSPSFANKGMIPSRHTCDGANVSPALTWTTPPDDARSLVLIIDDPDAPDPAAPKITWVHWVLYNIPPETLRLDEGILAKSLPHGTLQGVNDWHRTGYSGPCPPVGQHRYFHKLFALDCVLPDLRNPTRRVLDKAMHDHILTRTELIGLYRLRKSTAQQ